MASVWCELVCDKCSVTISGCYVSSGPIPKRTMEKEARDSGWKVTRTECLCDYCSKGKTRIFLK